MREEAIAYRHELIATAGEVHGIEGGLEDVLAMLQQATDEATTFGDGLRGVADAIRNRGDSASAEGGGSGGIDVEQIVEPYVEAAARIADIEDATEERRREMLRSQIERIRESLLSEEELRGEKLERDLNGLAEGFEAQLISEEDYLERREALRQQFEEAQAERHLREIDAENRAAQERERVIESAEQMIQSMKIQTARMAVGLLDTLGGENKKWAVASIALHKALSIAETKMNTATAVMRAYTMDPTGALAAKVATMGKIQIGIIAATGLAQAAMGGSGGGSGGGGGGGSSRSAGAPAIAERQVTQTYRVEGLRRGDIVSADSIIDLLNDAGRRGLVPEWANA
jgi:hypothetical protein